MSSETDGDAGYVHTPETDSGEAGPTDTRPGESGRTATAEPDAAVSESQVDGFGRKGWALTAVLFTCVLIIPGIIYVYPYAAGSFGFTFFATYLALPLVPAALLGLVAVWSMTAATRD
ncbi:hypothetical protein [Halorubrum sp. CBA1125]|uniref:hypothetical protein n=1 Tax=Halorubrum sp. CBA1125 TaxID=2668072 RepID=UPI002AA29FAD|nr:hypothetical protein [Halorubrum sp. CBA1125]